MPLLAYTKPADNCTPVCCSTLSPKLIPEVEYRRLQNDDPQGIRRPLSPVRLRHDYRNGSPPKVLTMQEKNETRARNSPFVNHMPKKKKEHYLYTIGSVKEPDDPYLLVELSLSSKLGKIVSPIKPSQSLHLPLERKMIRSKGTNVALSSDKHYFPKSTTVGMAHDKGTTMILRSKLSVNGEEYNVNGDEMLWTNLAYDNGPIVPSIHAPNAQLLAMNTCATPNTAISDLSDRDTMTPLYSDRDRIHTRASGGGSSGIYGDFEDDLVSGGVNEDEYIEDIM